LSVQKTGYLLAFLSVMLGFMFFTILLPLATLMPTVHLGPEWSLAAIALFLAISLDLILGQLRNVLRSRKEALSYEVTRLGARAASMYKYICLVGSGYGLLLVILALGFFSYFLVSATEGGQLVLRPGFFAVAGVYAAYFALRLVLPARLHMLTARLSGLLLKQLPTYSLEPDGIMIDFRVKTLGPPARRSWIAKICFEELDQVRVFNSFQEANMFMRNSVGPDLKLVLKQTTGLYHYARGEIARPSVYSRFGSLGTTILLRGKDLFYMISFENKDASDLVRAFEEFKKIPGTITTTAEINPPMIGGATRFCISCGAGVQADAYYCGKCGAKQTQVSAFD